MDKEKLHIQNLDPLTVKKQMEVGQTISKINTLLEISEQLKDWEGVQRLEIYLRIEEKLLYLIEKL
jgi:hypothetical protein|tara:strand:+ start:398 stop:595 length:198 start_codon:yes stop_codon:yes gene_type:complete